MAAGFISDAKLECRADDLLRCYEAQEGSILRPPVPIDLLIENLLQIDIDWVSFGLPCQTRVFAAVEMTASHRRIWMNEDERKHFEQFVGTEAYSKAHEVGHAVLHLPSNPNFQPLLLNNLGPAVLCRSDQRDAQEFQAERFAAFLLMPERLIRAAYDGGPITSWAQVYRLREAFGVSVTAMRRRLEALNLLHVDAAGSVHPSRESATGQQRLFG